MNLITQDFLTVLTCIYQCFSISVLSEALKVAAGCCAVLALLSPQTLTVDAQDEARDFKVKSVISKRC